MYSYDEVMELLEVQRKSVMEFEDAKNKLLVSGLIEKSDILAEKLNTMKTKNKNLLGKVVEIQAELQNLKTELPNIINSKTGDIDKFLVAMEAVEEWEEEVIHDMVCKIKTYADKRDCDLWEDWVLDTLGNQAKRVMGSRCVNYILHIQPLDK